MAYSNLQIFIVELIGTFLLVVFATGSIVYDAEVFDGKYDQQIDEYLREKPKKERKGFLKNQRNTLRGLNSDIEELRSNVLRQMEYMSEGLSTDDYSQMDKTEKKLVDDFYKISPYLNPLELKNYNS